MDDQLIKDDINLFNNNQQFPDNVVPEIDINLSDDDIIGSKPLTFGPDMYIFEIVKP